MASSDVNLYIEVEFHCRANITEVQFVLNLDFVHQKYRAEVSIIESANYRIKAL